MGEVLAPPISLKMSTLAILGSSRLLISGLAFPLPLPLPRRSFPLEDASPVTTPFIGNKAVRKRLETSRKTCSSLLEDEGRPPLRLLETRWVCVGDVFPSEMAEDELLPGARYSEVVGTNTHGSKAEQEGMGEDVWLIAGRTDNGFAAFCDAIANDDDGLTSGAREQGECLAHLMMMGPGAAGGDVAAVGRLKR